MKEVKQPKKPLAYFYVIVLIAVFLINALLLPRIAHQRIQDVDYGTFMTMSEEQKTAYAVCWKDYENLRDRFRAVDRWTQEHYDSTGFTKEEQQKRTNDYEELKALEAKLKESGDALNTLFRNPITLRWNRSIINWYKEDSDINDVYVDFR